MPDAFSNHPALVAELLRLLALAEQRAGTQPGDGPFEAGSLLTAADLNNLFGALLERLLHHGHSGNSAAAPDGLPIAAGGLADDCVHTQHIADGAVSRSQIADGAVGSAQLDRHAVGREALVDAAVGADQLADATVSLEKLTAEALAFLTAPRQRNGGPTTAGYAIWLDPQLSFAPEGSAERPWYLGFGDLQVWRESDIEVYRLDDAAIVELGLPFMRMGTATPAPNPAPPEPAETRVPYVAAGVVPAAAPTEIHAVSRAPGATMPAPAMGATAPVGTQPDSVELAGLTRLATLRRTLLTGGARAALHETVMARLGVPAAASAVIAGFETELAASARKPSPELTDRKRVGFTVDPKDYGVSSWGCGSSFFQASIAHNGVFSADGQTHVFRQGQALTARERTQLARLLYHYGIELGDQFEATLGAWMNNPRFIAFINRPEQTPGGYLLRRDLNVLSVTRLAAAVGLPALVRIRFARPYAACDYLVTATLDARLASKRGDTPETLSAVVVTRTRNYCDLSFHAVDRNQRIVFDNRATFSFTIHGTLAEEE